MKTWISEAAGPDESIGALMAAADYFGVKQKRARAIVAEVVAAVATWRDLGTSLGLTTNDLDTLAPAFDHPEHAVARRLAGRLNS